MLTLVGKEKGREQRRGWMLFNLGNQILKAVGSLFYPKDQKGSPFLNIPRLEPAYAQIHMF